MTNFPCYLLPIVALSSFAGVACSSAQGIPEPGIVLYGRVEDVTGGLVSGGRIEGQIGPLAFSEPLEFIVSPSVEVGINYVVVLECQSDLGDPDFPVDSSALVLGDTYTFSSLTLVDATSTSYALSFVNPAQSELALSTSDRGVLIRLDLSSDKEADPGSDDYWAWAEQFWPDARNNPDAHPDADPDGDGIPNRDEKENGTDPDGIKLKIESIENGMVNLRWDGADTVMFTVERSSDLGAANRGFVDIGDVQGGAFGDPDGTAKIYFYRIRVKGAQ